MPTQNSGVAKASESARREASAKGEMQPYQDTIQYLREYAREQPEMAALWCLGIGFVLGWKLKPW